jgi:hypothetical protein
MEAEKTTREKLEQHIDSMRAERSPYEQDWAEIGRLALPNKVDIKSPHNNNNSKRRANTTTKDSGGRISARRLVNGMATGLTNASQPWFKLGTRDPDLIDYAPVKEWLKVVEDVLYFFFSRTNYYDTTKMQYADLGVMGLGCVISAEHPEYMGVYHHAPVGTYYLSIDDGLRASRLVRYTRPTVEQVYEMVRGDETKVSRQVKDAYAKGNYNIIVPCVHVIERNYDAKGRQRSPSVKKPWRSIKWEIGNDDKKVLLSERGYDSQPFTAPRWETVGQQAYCDTAPGFDALPDMRELQLTARRKSQAMDGIVRPPLAAPAGLARSMLSLDPGSINFIDAQSGDVVRPLLQHDPRLLTEIRTDKQATQQRIDELFYADLFMAITDMEGIQPRNEQELLFRNEEKLTQLGPVVDRVNLEKLEIDIDRAFTICKNLGMIPPPPDELRNQPLAVEFISILARAQKQADNTNIERAARFVGYLAGIFPDATLKFDAEQAVDEYTRSLGVTPRIIRSDELVAEMKQQMAQKQQAEQVAQMAPAMRDGAEAAKLLSETRVDDAGTSALQRALGQ